MKNKKIEEINKMLEQDIKDIQDRNKLNDLKVKYLGKKGLITELNSEMKTIPNEEKKEYGQKVNELRNKLNNFYEKKKEEIETTLLNEKLANEEIDISLPATKINIGSPNILEKLIEEIEEVFMSMGYDVVDGPEVEEDKYNFEMLNIPVRTMLSKKGVEPVRVICPGKTYRRDDDDATHSHQFMQIEGLLVDKNISLSDLKGTIDVIVKHLFGENIETRFRPSYYQFTEPLFTQMF